MLNHSLSLFRFRNINSKWTNNLFLVLVMVVFVFLPCGIKVPLSFAIDNQREPNVGGLMEWKPSTQDGGDAVRFFDVLQINQRINEGDLEQQAFGVPQGSLPVLLVSTSDERVSNELPKDGQNCTGGQPDKYSKWLHSYLIGLILGVLLTIPLLPLVARFSEWFWGKFMDLTIEYMVSA